MSKTIAGGYSRRELMQLSAASMAGLGAARFSGALGAQGVAAAPATPAASGSGSEEFDVIVVGAGVAGMGAGQKLRLLGLNAVLLEARDRIGGRCFCDNSFPAPFDFGGQFFQQVVPKLTGGTNNPLYDIYIAEGGPDEPCVLIPTFYQNGVRLSDADQQPFLDMNAAVGVELAATGTAVRLGAPDMSVTDATADLAGEPWYTAVMAFLGLAFDADAANLSVLDVWNDIEPAINLDGSPSDKVNPSGMGNFVAQFANHLDIRLSTPVTEIDMTGADQITVTTDQGPLTAKAVIVTAPTTVLAKGDIAFTPELPAEYTQAFQDLPFGLVDKFGIAFSKDIFGDTPPNTIITRHEDTARFGMALAKLAGKPMMNLFVAEDLAHELEAGGEDAFLAYAQEFLNDTYGSEAAQAIERTVIHPWGTDPLTMGSYSAAKVGKVSARTTLAQPIDNRLYFAGEAITENAHSSLHGAFLTGQAAAQGIFDAVKGTQ